MGGFGRDGADAVSAEPAQGSAVQQTDSPPSQTDDQPFFDARSDAAVQQDDEDILLSFLQPSTEAEVRDKWEKRKAELTQDYKRRHREAIKKKRRRVGGIVGSHA